MNKSQALALVWERLSPLFPNVPLEWVYSWSSEPTVIRICYSHSVDPQWPIGHRYLTLYKTRSRLPILPPDAVIDQPNGDRLVFTADTGRFFSIEELFQIYDACLVETPVSKKP